MHDPQRDRWPLRRSPLARLAGVALLLCFAGPSPTAAAADEVSPVFAAARSAVANGWHQNSKALGFTFSKSPFTDLPRQGAILVGFDLGVGKFLDIDTVYAIRPVFLAGYGEVVGRDHGLFRDRWQAGKPSLKSPVVRTAHLRARPGYAVGGVTVRSGLNINGLSVTFMRIDGRALDPQRSYTSAWVGDRTGGSEAYVGGGGAPVLGIYGGEDEVHVKSLGLIFMKQLAVAPQRPEGAVEVPAPPVWGGEPAAAPAPPKVERPAQAPAPARGEPPADPAPKAEVPAPAAPAPNSQGPEKSAGPHFVLFMIFGVLGVVIFVTLVVEHVRHGQVPDRAHVKVEPQEGRRPKKPGPPGARPERKDDLFDARPDSLTLPMPEGPSDGVCERPNPGRPRPAADAAPTGPTSEPSRGAARRGRGGRPRVPAAPASHGDHEKPSWRAYYHQGCGEVTIVGGDDYVRLECPFRPVDSTYCCNCQAFVPLDQVRWADSDEKVSAYRARVLASVPFWRKVYLFLFASASEGAVNWGVEWKGQLEQDSDEPEEQPAPRRRTPPAPPKPRGGASDVLPDEWALPE